MTSVFEVCNTTSDEIYFPLGVYLTLEDAIAEINKSEEAKEMICEDSEEFEEVSIFERKIGWSGHGTKVFQINREEYYDENDDEYYWRKINI